MFKNVFFKYLLCLLTYFQILYRVGQMNPYNYFHAVQAWISQGIREAMV